jgi:transposase InsO family protein
MFRAPAPNLLWVSDFAYVSMWQSFIYVVFVVDTFADRIVGPLSADLAMPNRLPVNGTGLTVRQS